MMESPLALARRFPAVRRRLLQQQSSRSFSSASNTSGTTNKPNGGNDTPEATSAAAQPNQPFVQTRITAGEWDPARTNPLYRPKYKSRAKIISADDFANRPAVGFYGEFDSFQDAMVTLTWLDVADHLQIYTLYTDLISHAATKYGVTSHEYVVRVIAQKYNITPERVAGIVQLQHNEEQIKINDPDRVLNTQAAEFMDGAVKKEINDAYQTFGLKKPDEFVEDPVGVAGSYKQSQWQVVEDVFDVDQMMQDTMVREDRQARLAIDGHHYIEDIDDEEISIPMSKDAKRLLKKHEKLAAAAQQPAAETTKWPEHHMKTRPRWKFIAQTVNTRELKKKRADSLGYHNNSPANTLVEHNGTLREGTMADVKLTSWKPVRHVQEHSYQGAKQGWLNRNKRGDEKAWGMAPPPPKKPEEPVAAAAAVKEEGDNEKEDKPKEEAADGSSSDESSSSDEDEDGAESDSDSSDDDTTDDENKDNDKDGDKPTDKE